MLQNNCLLKIIKGNHDPIIEPITKKRDVTIANQVILDDILITHGDKELEIPKHIKTIIIGHEHPAVGIESEERREIFKCFLKGKYKSKTLIVQPSANLVREGVDVLEQKFLGPFIKKVLTFNCYVVADKVYEFGKLKNL